MFLFLILLGLVPVALAQVSGIEVVGSTNVQSVLRYSAGSSGPCSIEISEFSDFRAVVPDVNSVLFPGSNLDSRPGTLIDGLMRTFVAGKRAVEKGSDGKWYSRALQTDTTHYFRILCGAQKVAGSFRTATVPLAGRPWLAPRDETGNFRWPSTDNDDRSQKIIDPNYGTLIRRISVPGEMAAALNLTARKFAAAAGSGWTNAAGALADDGQSASALGGAGFLALTSADLPLAPVYLTASSIDNISVTLKGSATAATAPERTVEACLTIDGATCYSDIRTANFNSTQTTVTIGSQKRVDTWGKPLWVHDVASNTKFGVLLRPKGPVSVQFASISLVLSGVPGMLDAGNFRACSPLKSNGGYHCSFPGANGSGANYLYWIQPDTGEVRWLGAIQATNWGGATRPCLSSNALWDVQSPNVYYCMATLNGASVLLKGTYTGNDQAAASNATAAFQWQNLTPGANTITDLIKKMDAQFDPTQFACKLGNISGDYAVFGCYRNGQDSYAWIAVFHLGNRLPIGQGGTGGVVALNVSFQSPATRWCGLHSFEPLSGFDWVGWTPKTMNGNTAGPFKVKLQTSLPAAKGRFIIQVSGEPQPALMPAATGDTFQILNTSGTDLLRIVEKRSSTQWVVDRTVLRGQPTATFGEMDLIAICAAYMPDPGVAPAVYWSFQEDPRSLDVMNTKTVVEKVLTGGHLVQRGNYRLQPHWADGFQVTSPGAPKSWNYPVTYRIPSNPQVNGVRAYIGMPEPYQGLTAYQTHPSYENYLATAPRNSWFVDLMPFIGLPQLTSGIRLVPGFQQVYKPATKLNLHRSVFPTFAKCGGRMLREVAGPITDADAYSFCVGGRCATGAGADDVFLNCPAPVTSSSRCSDAFFGDAASVCISDLPPFGQAVSQFYLDGVGNRARPLTNAMMPVHSPRTPLILDTASPLPDGSWVVFPSFSNNARKDLYMVKVPSDPPAGTTTGSALSLDVRAPAGLDVSHVSIEYGDSSLGLLTNATACRGGCRVDIPASKGDVLYTRVVYRNAYGVVVGTSKVEVQLTDGVKGPGQKVKIRNAASQEDQLAPGAVASWEGDALPECESSASGSLPQELCGVAVLVNGEPAPLYQVGAAGIKFQVPNTAVPGQELSVTSGSQTATVSGSDVLSSVPALYSYSTESQISRAIVWSGNSNRLRLGDTAVIYANSLGLTDPEVAGGAPAPVQPLAVLKQNAEVYINGVRQKVLFAGLAPGQVGIYQVNFEIDASTPVLAENQNNIWIRVGDRESAHLVVDLDSASIAVER